jgi:hypothetical protein
MREGGTVIDSSIQEYLESGFESMYSGKWKPIFPGASAIETNDVGILVIHDREEHHLAFAAGVLGGMQLSPDLVRAVGKLNRNIVLGAYVLGEGQPDYWSITYAIKLRYNWIDRSTASAQLILDSLRNVPAFVELGIKELSAQFGGEPWGTPGGWYLALMDSF